MFRLLRFLTGVFLLPLCAAVTLALLDILRSISGTGAFLSPDTMWLLAGYFLWLCMWFLMPQPVRTYVVAHELTHALWGIFFGSRVRNLQITSRGGSVSLSRTNLLITLAPYFFPLYTVIVILLRLLTGWFIEPVPLPHLWLFLVGLTWGFHVCFTVQSLMIEQPDINEYGRLFSYTVIYLFNLAGVGLWIVCTTAARFGDFSATLLLHTSQVYAYVWEGVHSQLAVLLAKIKPWLRNRF